MAPKSKSVFRQPGAKHFQLVHRSQRDPLIHDPEASQRVLKQIVRENDKKGKSRAELENIISPDDLRKDVDAHVGEAAMYGIYYDDSQYDYMQHLRTYGLQEEGVDSVLIEAPSTSTAPAKDKKSATGIIIKDEIPSEALPSKYEMPRNYDSQQAIPEDISGFQPDMDPHLRQVLEALEDDAFVEDELEEDFFGELVKEGERGSDEELEFDFYDDDEPALEASASTTASEEDEKSWEARFAKFKKEQHAHPLQAPSDDEDLETEMADTISGLPSFSVIGGKGKKRRKGSSDASGYTMSSASMYRNENLQTLDDRFDQLMMKEYGSDEEEAEDSQDSDDDEEAPQLITARDDFASMIEELDGMELLGRRMRPKLAGESGAEKLETLRTAMGQDERVRDRYSDDEDSNDDDIYAARERDEKERWDCETILTTHSNMENHPRLIRAFRPKPESRIILDPKTGLPSIQEEGRRHPKSKQARFQDDEGTEESAEEDRPHRATITRSRNESKEDKKARKTEVKAQKASRRAEKKASKTAFHDESQYQARKSVGQETERLRKL